MNGSFDEAQPIFQQIAEMIEDDILNGTYAEEDQIISMAQFSKTFQVNPATAVKGIGLLINEGILYKKRGLGMFVAEKAKENILKKRRERFYEEFMSKLLAEAEKLDLDDDDIFEMIKRKRKG